MGKDLSVKSYISLTSNNGVDTRGENGFDFPLKSGAEFGSSITNLGDIDNDGVQDIAVGAKGLNNDRGAIFILMMNKNGTVKEYTPIFSRHNMNLKLSEMDNFGESVLAIGDLDYDGITELLVGSNTYL